MDTIRAAPYARKTAPRLYLAMSQVLHLRRSQTTPATEDAPKLRLLPTAPTRHLGATGGSFQTL